MLKTATVQAYRPNLSDSLLTMQKFKILIIDDETDYCMIMKSYFLAKKHEVFLAHTLKEGLASLEDNKPDVLFLDNNLPDGQGWDHIDSIVEKFPQLRIYLVSAYRQRSDVNHPSPNIRVWEKPISLNTLDTVFK